MSFYTNVQNVKSKIFFRGVDDQGNHFNQKVDYNPSLYISSTKESKWKTLEGESVSEIPCGSINEARNFIRKYENIDNFKIYGNTNFHYCFITDNYPGTLSYDISQIGIANIDIETGSENGFPDPQVAQEEIISISVKFKDKFFSFGCGEFKSNQENVHFMRCNNETHLLQEFLLFWEKLDIDIVTGWNVKFFDIPYLINRMNRLFDKPEYQRLSPWRFVSERTVNQMGFGGTREQQAFELVGVATLDYLDLYRKFTYTQQENYRLDHIAHVELGDRKLDYSEFGSLHQLYKQDFQKFMEYNIKDVDLVDRLEDKLKLIETAIVLAYDAKVNYTDVFTQVRMWDTLIYNELRDKGIVLPPKKNTFKDSPYEGAYVKEPKPGAYNWVVSFDLNSLYPHLIMQYNVSPETMVPNYPPQPVSVDKLLDREIDTTYCQQQDLSISANGYHFRRDIQGFLPAMMERMYNERSKFKIQMLETQKLYEKEKNPTERIKISKEVARLDNMQMARKIQLNSAYGALGNQYFRFFDVRQAEAITTGGQLATRWVERDVNKYLNAILKTEDKDYVIASDTDSIYVCLDDLVKSVFDDTSDIPKVIDFLDKVCDGKVQECIDRSFKGLSDYMNAYQQKMNMKREVLADRAIWTGKKHYIINVHDSEGVRFSKPKVKVKGLESVKSSTPAIVRQKLVDAYKILMNDTEDDMINFIERFRNEFEVLPPEDVAFPRSVKGIAKYSDPSMLYKKGTPIHVKGTIIHNKLLKEHKLTRKYQIIQEGEKIKFSYLKIPNPVGDTVISMGNTLPKEFDLHRFIDYNAQFEKTFLGPLKDILNCVGWDHEKRNTIEDFFI
tara:strand:- start:13872 stop:16391 length:2520 start_codon:yes stop_codon:yes gene_type:complete